MAFAACLAFGVRAEAAPTSATSASATDETAACFDDYERAQVERQKGNLLEARRAAQECRASVCPAELADSCLAWERELGRDIPTAVFSVRQADGTDARGYTVEIDGQARPDALSGSALELDPGPHDVRVVGPDGFVEEMHLVMSVGERSRPVIVRVGKEAPPPPPPPPPSRITPFVITAAGVGVAGFAVATVGTIIALDAKSTLDGCRGACPASEVRAQLDQAHTWLTVADVGLVVGIVGVGTAIGFYLWGGEDEPSAVSARVGFVPTPGGAFGALGGTF